MRRVMLCLTVVCLALGCSRKPGPSAASSEVSEPARTEDQAIEIVQRRGGQVVHENEQPGKPVVAVNFADINVNERELRSLAQFKKLTELNLSGTHLSDSPLKELAVLQSLTTLDLSYNMVTDVGLKE